MKKVLIWALAGLALGAIQLPAQNYKQTNKFVLGGEGGWDYLTYDGSANRLFITRGDHVMVVDADSGKVLGDLPANGAHGVALVPDKNRGFISNGKANTVTPFDMKTLKTLPDIKVGEGPDAIIYDANSDKVVVMNGRGKSVMAIDPEAMKVVGTVAVGSKVEFAAAEPGHVYVNLEDTSEIANIDSSSWKLLAKWPTKPCEEPSGLAIDPESHRLFTVCDKVMAVVDAESGKIVATPAIGEGPDAAAFDAGKKLALASCGDGTLTAVREDGADKYSVAQTIPTQKGARTMALDAKTHRVFLVTSEFGEKAAGERRAPQKPGTFTLLVYAPQ